MFKIVDTETLVGPEINLESKGKTEMGLEVWDKNISAHESTFFC